VSARVCSRGLPTAEAGQNDGRHLASDAVSPLPPDPQMTSELLDKQAIHEVILRYCRAIDRLDEAGVRACFHPGATDTHGSFHGTVDEFVAWAFGLLRRYDATMHLVANHLTTVRGAAAVAETYGIAHHRSADPDPKRNLTIGFRYLDRLDRRDGGPWLISRRIATTEWVRAPGIGTDWPIPADSAVGARDRTDPVFDLLAELGD
jgi:hypothetical protein